MKWAICFCWAALLSSTSAWGAEHLIRPGDAPQEKLDQAAPGDRLVFLPGLHQHGLGRHRSMLYVDKSVEIELREGAILRLAPGVTQREPHGEITTDQDAGKKLDDLEIGGQFDLSRSTAEGPELYGSTIYTIVIDRVGADGAADTFAWGDGKLFETPHTKVPITGEWQELSHGVKVRFRNRTGHSVRSLWFVSYDGPEAYGIRIGHGRQPEYIENVRIVGKGTIDLNSANNALPSGLVKNINACVLVHGRVRNVWIEGITMTNTMRSVMAYGEHTGEFLPGGKVGPGESFDVEKVTVQRTRTINPQGSGYLFGHPSFRGRIRDVRCNDNYMETATTAIEPNFQLDGYEVIGNVIKSGGQAIHCWRHSTNGVIADNLRIHDNSGKPVVVVNAPRGWQAPDPPVLRNNRNHLSDAPRLNVLLLMADDLRPELASYGSPAITPHLTELASRSVQFDRAYCQQAVCNPSRSSLLTGRRPDSLRVWNNSTHFREPNPDVTTIPLWFKQQGYTSRCVGKIFHNWHTAVHGDPKSWSAPEFLHYANHGDDLPQVTGPLPQNHAQTTSGFGYEKAGICECRDVPDEAYYDGRVAAEAIRVLGEVKDRPFFLAVGFWKPHAHFNAPKRYWDLYDRAKLPPLDDRRPSGSPDLAFHQSTEVLGAVATQKKPTPEQSAEMRHGYFANISYMDAQLGKVLAALQNSGVADRTIVVFLSDHGYHIGEHTLWGKTSNFELDARVPLLVHLPRMAAAGKRTRSLVELIDLFPTLVELCALPRPEGLQGTSLVPVLQDPQRSVKEAAFTQHPRPAYYDRTPSKTPTAMGVSVRTAEARYTEWRDWKTGDVVARELYEEADEPAETRNRIGVPETAKLQSDAEQLLRRQFPLTPHPSPESVTAP